MEKIIRRLKEQAEENPVVVMGAGAALVHALSKLLDSNTARKAAKTHAKEVARRINQPRYRDYRRR